METDTDIRKYIIYKYPKLVEFVKNYYQNYNPIYDNPYFDPKWYISKNSSDNAIDQMIEKPELVCFETLMFNTNPRIRLLIEGRTHFSKQEWYYMSSSCNSYIMEFLEQNLDNINWERLSSNKYEGAIRILKNNPDKINWFFLNRNTSAIEIFKVHPDKIRWNSVEFCANPNAIELIEEMVKKNWEKINFKSLSVNPNAIHIISKHMDKDNWKMFSKNPSAISILMENPDKISFYDFLENPNAIPYIETVMEKRQIEQLDLDKLEILAENPNSIPLIQKWWDEGKISMENMIELIPSLCKKSVYECYDFQKMSKERSKLIYLELISKAFNPSRVDKWLEYYIENGGCCENFDWV